MADEADNDDLKADQKIVDEAQKRFDRCEKWESQARKHYLNDTKFANGDSDNNYQWPDNIRQQRDVDQKPCLTINKTAQQNLQIVNDAKKNKPGVNVRPVGNEASFKAAEAFEGVIRHIEYISDATTVYDTATETQVDGGVGYWRVVTAYENDDSFDQEIYLRRIRDPLTVFTDPDAQQADGSDARFGFIFEDVPRDEFLDQYPDDKDIITTAALGYGNNWIDKDHVRVAEYYKQLEKQDELIAFTSPESQQPMTMRKSEIPPEVYKALKDSGDPNFRTRDIIDHQVKWYKIVGDKIVDRADWLGKYIPIVKIVGKETVINGVMDRKGHTRQSKDPQRMYNYWSSCGVEQGALQTKTPWLAPAEAIEGYENYWRTANTVNHSILPYNGLRDDGSVIPAPTRADPPVMASAYIEGMKISANEMMMASGQYEATMGEKSNETSGKAIAERQRQGDTATYHFIDNLAIGVRYTGKILIDLIPKIYDTKRVRKILAKDGTETQVTIDPQAKEAFQITQMKENKAVAAIFNPSVGQYDVQADVGPNYATQRQEAFNAFSNIAAQSPELMGVIGDLLFKNADFPGADEIAERLERMVPAQAKGGPSPEIMQLQGQLQNMQGVISKLLEELSHEKLKVKTREEQKDIDVYEAITKRLDVILDKVMVTPKDSAQMLHDVMMEEHTANLQTVIDANKADLAPAPMPEAQ